VLFADLLAVAIAQHGFKHDADRHRQFADRANTGFFKRGQVVIGVFLARRGFERLAGIEQIVRHRGFLY
jgi:hypothetical protein